MNKKSKIGNLLLIGFLVRFILYLLGKYFIYLPHSDGDALVIENKAFIFANSNDLDYFSIFSQGHNFLAYIFSFVYEIFGRVEFLLSLIMVFLGTLLIKYVHDASFLIWQDAILAKKVAWITVFFPQFCVHSALLLREIPFNIFLLIAVISFIKYNRSLNYIYLWKSFLFILMSMFFHSGSVVVFFGLFFYYIFRSRKKNTFFNKFLITGSIVFLIFFVNSQGFGLGKFGNDLGESLDNLYLRESIKTAGFSDYPDWMRLSGGISDILIIPIRFITFLFSPLIPFLVKSPGHLLGAIDSLFYLYMFRLLYKNRKLLKFKDEYKIVVNVCLSLALVFSLGVTNVGTAIRHRAKFAPLLLIILFEKRTMVNTLKRKL